MNSSTLIWTDMLLNRHKQWYCWWCLDDNVESGNTLHVERCSTAFIKHEE